jgi:HEPN domain-containing protein
MAGRDKRARLFQRAADQRLTTAEFLLNHGYYLDAVYLAGYAVECSLKALILRRTPRGQVPGMLRRLTAVGVKGHDYEYLKEIVKEQVGGRGKADREVLTQLTTNLQYVGLWSTDLRYQVGMLAPREAQQFLAAAKAIRDWCARS